MPPRFPVASVARLGLLLPLLCGCAPASPNGPGAAPLLQDPIVSILEITGDVRDAAGPASAEDTLLADIEKLAFRCRSMPATRTDPGPSDVVDALVRCVFFAGEDGRRPDGLVLAQALVPGHAPAGTEGTCLAMSYLFIVLGHRLGLPVRGVVVPGHFFVRYDDGRTRINIEPLAAGARKTDSWYRRTYAVPAVSSCYLRSLDARESMAPLYYNLGNIRLREGRFDDACRLYEKALEILPGLAEAHGNLGLACYRSGNLARAETELRRAFELNPRHPAACLDLGVVLQARGDLRRAESCYLKGLSLFPSDARLAHALGTVYRRSGRIPAAIRMYRRALVSEPGFDAARRDLDSILPKTTPGSPSTERRAAPSP
ncbi:MAG: tetratricopeptide repeat protein [Planctomycetes bacterium]|nr:tetratricopeptide repeat protein [Planctomycetota bacterium]